MIFTVNVRERKAPESMNGKSNSQIWKESIELMRSSVSGMTEEQKESYKNRIRQKMKSGKKLSADEMNFLRMNDVNMYCSALRVENARQILRTRLKNCKSKEQVESVVSGEYVALKETKSDPDGEYLSAMVRQEVGTFKKSNAYARLPRRIETDRRKIIHASEKEIWKEEESVFSSNTRAVLGQMQMQCDMISQMSEAFAG